MGTGRKLRSAAVHCRHVLPHASFANAITELRTTSTSECRNTEQSSCLFGIVRLEDGNGRCSV